jgi:hypothetical protein
VGLLPSALLYALLLASGLGALHVALLLGRQRPRILAFFVGGALVSLLAGYGVIGPLLRAHAARSWSTGLVFTVALACGLTALGSAAAGAWILATKGGSLALARWWRDRGGARPPATGR